MPPPPFFCLQIEKEHKSSWCSMLQLSHTLLILSRKEIHRHVCLHSTIIHVPIKNIRGEHLMWILHTVWCKRCKRCQQQLMCITLNIYYSIFNAFKLELTSKRISVQRPDSRISIYNNPISHCYIYWMSLRVWVCIFLCDTFWS